MPYVVGLIDGIETSRFVPLSQIDSARDELLNVPYSWFIVFDLHSKFDANVSLELQVFQKSNDFFPENLSLKLKWFDSYHGDEILNIQGNMNDDENDLFSLVNVANATEEFESFEIYLNTGALDLVEGVSSFNKQKSLGRNVRHLELPEDTDKAPLTNNDLYDALVEFEDRPNYLVMFFNDDVQMFQTLLRASETLNVPFYVELDPKLQPEQMVQIANDLSAYSHRVIIIVNGVVARPNSAQVLRGKKYPRYGVGTLMGYTLLRNANTDAQGFADLKNPVAGYNFPMRWAGMEMRKDVKFNEDVRVMLAKAKVNVILLEHYDTGPRYVLSDCLTQYDSKTSVLRLMNSAEISMVIDNRLINICKRHLLKGKATFKSDALRECEEFLEAVSSDSVGWLVKSEDLGGKYVINITDRVDRPHDAVNLHAGYRPEGCTRAVYLTTSVHK